jgi:uncharacterized protein (TIGR02246 family)
MQLLTVLAAGFLLSHAPVRGGMVGVAADDAAIRSVADAYAAAMRAGDAPAAAALFADDAVEMPPGKPAVRGRPAIEAYYTGLFRTIRFLDFALSHTEVRSAGDVAFVVGTSRETIAAGDARHEETGKYLVVLKRVGGAWKVADASYSSDGPCGPAGPPPAR